MKNSTLYLGAILVLVVVAGYFVFSSGTVETTGNVVSNSPSVNPSGEIQNVVLSIKNYNYYPQEIRVKEGVPVRISLDKSVVGCYRSFTLREFGVAKNLPTPQDYVEFTPNKKGSFRFACSMGMGTGTLIVE